MQGSQNQPTDSLSYFVITGPGNNLFIRKNPGKHNKTSYDIIAGVPRGTQLVVLENHNDTVRIDGFIWWEIIEPVNNISGWVASDYLSTNPADVNSCYLL